MVLANGRESSTGNDSKSKSAKTREFGKTIALIRWTFVGKVVSLLFNMLSRLVIAFLPRNTCLLISWLQSPSAEILEPKKTKSTVCIPFIVRILWEKTHRCGEC